MSNEYKDLNTNVCAQCGCTLTQDEKANFMKAKLPPVCDLHLQDLKERIKKCAPLFATIKF